MRITAFTTESGSAYECDGTRIRRISGVIDPTPYQGIEGQWQAFVGITKVKIGQPVHVLWRCDGGVMKTTLTSNVVLIHEFERRTEAQVS